MLPRMLCLHVLRIDEGGHRGCRHDLTSRSTHAGADATTALSAGVASANSLQHTGTLTRAHRRRPLLDCGTCPRGSSHIGCRPTPGLQQQAGKAGRGTRRGSRSVTARRTGRCLAFTDQCTGCTAKARARARARAGAKVKARAVARAGVPTPAPNTAAYTHTARLRTHEQATGCNMQAKHEHGSHPPPEQMVALLVGAS